MSFGQEDECIPAIIIGWAVKYRELAREMQQEQYCIDVRQDFDMNHVLCLVEAMDSKYQQESEIIKERIDELRKNSIFDIVKNDYEACNLTRAEH